MYQTVTTVINMLVAANAVSTEQIAYALSDTLVGRWLGVHNRGRTLSDVIQSLKGVS
jgi:hypothetical protein